MTSRKNNKNGYRKKIIREKQKRRNSLHMGVICIVVCIIMVCAVCQGNLRKTEGAQDAAAEDTGVYASYFSESLLVGGLRAKTLGAYSGEPEWNVCAAENLTTENIMTAKAACSSSGEACTVLEFTARKEYESIYLSFGLEELNMYNEEFISGYKEFLSALTKQQPSAHIYVMSVLPVSAELSSADSVYNNPAIDKVNLLLESMCEAYDSVTYLDVASCVAEAGVLPEDAGDDGININEAYCQKIMNYIIENEYE